MNLRHVPTHALSLRQPWAHFVVHLGKDIENRRWSTKFRGEFLIHAAKGMTRSEYEDACEFAMVDGDVPPIMLPAHNAIHRGGIVGIARLVEVLVPCAPVEHVAPRCACGTRWHMGAQYGFRLADVRVLPFVQCSGALGFFRVPEVVRLQIVDASAALEGESRG